MTIENFWVPMGTEYQPEKKILVPMGTGYRSDKKIKGTHGYRVPTKFVMPTPDLPFIMKLI